MARKARTTPKVRRLLGAPHAYLWGEGLFTRHDVPARKWKPFCHELIRQSREGGPSPGKRIKRLLKPKRWAEIEDLAGLEWPYDYIKNQVADALSGLLERRDFFEPESWRGISLPAGARDLLSRGPGNLALDELCLLNAYLLRAAYPGFTTEVEQWGDGVSVKMLRVLRAAGLDRIRFCLGGWSGVMRRPEVARKADEMGYLFGTYDCFHSVHNPSHKGTDASWETAQFDRKLYETGAVVRKNGKKVRGYQNRGYRLSPIAARPYVERRVNRVMAAVPFNYYFIDCDAYGEILDDYSPLHPATQADSINARNDRMGWVRDTHNLVIGSEGGSSYAAPVMHIAEGIVTPVFGWDDPDLQNRKSKYYLGAWYPPDGPDVFLKQVPLKEKFRRLYFDPRFRLPLYEIVFHDSVVSMHHWSAGKFKFSGVIRTVTLTELLYMVPPLYHLNLKSFKKRRAEITKHYAFFSPLHRELGFSRMTDFDWLTADRMVQRTVFDDEVEIIANFSDSIFTYTGKSIAAGSVLTMRRKTGETRTYTP